MSVAGVVTEIKIGEDWLPVERVAVRRNADRPELNVYLDDASTRIVMHDFWTARGRDCLFRDAAGNELRCHVLNGRVTQAPDGLSACLELLCSKLIVRLMPNLSSEETAWEMLKNAVRR